MKKVEPYLKHILQMVYSKLNTTGQMTESMLSQILCIMKILFLMDWMGKHATEYMKWIMWIK
jgi:hypothetical protein